MDTLTHALSGALLARAATPARPVPGTPGPRGRMLAGLAGGAFPDIDVIARAADTLWYLDRVHQGATHSLVLLPLWAVALAWLAGRVSGTDWRGWFVPVALGMGIHVAGDLVTAYGTMVLYPLSTWRPSLAWIYVVDPWVTLIVLGGLLAAWYRPAQGRTASLAALAVLAVYMGLQGIVQQRAVGVAEAYADALSLEGARATALPQPFSPAHWMLVVSEDDTHHMAWVRFLPGRSLAERVPLPRRLRDMAAHYTPEPVWQRHVRGGGDARMPEPATAAWRHDGFRHFRSFAQIPALHEVASEGGRDCAWFRDLRFALPGLPPSFLFGMCRDPADGLWHRVRRRGAMWLD